MAPEPEQNISDETLDFIFGHIKGAPSEQHAIWTALDGKMLSIFGIASAVIGLAGFSVAKGNAQPPFAVAQLLVLALGAYLYTLAVALIHLWPKEARHASYGNTLWPEAWHRTPKAIKHGLVTDITNASRANYLTLAKKATSVRVAVVSVGVETLLVGAAFVVRLVNP